MSERKLTNVYLNQGELSLTDLMNVVTLGSGQVEERRPKRNCSDIDEERLFL